MADELLRSFVLQIEDVGMAVSGMGVDAIGSDLLDRRWAAVHAAEVGGGDRVDRQRPDGCHHGAEAGEGKVGPGVGVEAGGG